jgi:hypothetical protein
VKFDNDSPALADRLTMSYYRVLGDSVYPNFSGSDFEGAYWVETFEDGSLSGWDEPAAIFYKPKFEKIAGTVGAFSLSLIGGNPLMAVWNGPNHAFKDNAGADATLTPTYVSLRVRGSDKTVSHGWAFFGNPNAEASGFGSFFREGGSLGFGAPTPTLVIPYTIETWYLIEYKNFKTVGASTTVDVYVDGKQKTPALPVSKATIKQVSLRNLADMSTSWIDQIIVR